jgi:hypothetical protein
MRRGDVDRGRLELSIPGTDQRGTAAPAGGIDQALIARRPGRRRSDCASDIGSLRGRVIPSLVDQDRYAQSRDPIEMIVQG